MDSALVIGGTRFIGRHTVEELLDQGYDVTLFNRGNRPNPFATDGQVDHIEGDRTNTQALETAAASMEPDAVFDFVAYQPAEVRTATEIFADVDAYVFVSSGASYDPFSIPKREDESPLRPCDDQQARDESMDTYGNRKAEGDREVFAAAERGVNAMSARPTVVYGPYDYTERLDYWIDRVNHQDRLIVPGDGTYLMHRVFVADVAAALRIIAEHGSPGEAYNVADRQLVDFNGLIMLIEDALGTEAEVIHASDRELSTVGLESDDFPLYRGFPHVMSTGKLAGLGWDSTDLDTAMNRTVEEHLASERTGRERGPDRETEEAALDVLGTI